MPLLDRNGWKQDDFLRSEDVSAGAAVLIPYASLGAALAGRSPSQRIGIDLPNIATPAELKPFQHDLALIAVAFPSFADGRGFSLGRMLREQGYAGILRASGSIIPDQFAFALACGFDEVELSDEQAARQPIEQWLAALGQIGPTYQSGQDGRTSIFKRRAAAA